MFRNVDASKNPEHQQGWRRNTANTVTMKLRRYNDHKNAFQNSIYENTVGEDSSRATAWATIANSER